MIKGEVLVSQDVHATAGVKMEINMVPPGNNPAGGFGAAMEEDNHHNHQHHHQVAEMGTIGERELWGLEDGISCRDQQQPQEEEDNNNLLDDASCMFYGDFPPLPDFPCMSSSSSSSSTPAAAAAASKPFLAATSSSSSSTSPTLSWAAIMTDEDSAAAGRKPAVGSFGQQTPALSSTASMEIHDGGAGLGDNDVDCCIDVMENFGYMDLVDGNDIWDPSSVFQSDDVQNPDHDEAVEHDFFLHQEQDQQVVPPMEVNASHQNQKIQCLHNDNNRVVDDDEEENDNNGGGFSFLQGSSELALIFFEWLKQNKDYISAEDMRNIKLKRSTIENASKRLGSTKEGKKQLLKLILEWVEQYQLQNKKQRIVCSRDIDAFGGGSGGPDQSPYPAPPATTYQQEPTPDHSNINPSPGPNPKTNLGGYNPAAVSNDHPNTCFSTSPWMQPAAPPLEPTPMVSAPTPPPPPPPSAYPQPLAAMYGGGGDPYSNQVPMINYQVVNGIPYPHPAGEYQIMDHTHQSWPALSPYPTMPPAQFSPFPDSSGNVIPHHQQPFYGHPYQVYDPNGERLMRLGSSVTKEARKKRMARQRRLYSHHHRHNSNANQNHNQMVEPHAPGDEGGDDGDQANSLGNWLYWSPGGAVSTPSAGNVLPVEAPQPNSGDRTPLQTQNYQRQASGDRRQQGWKTEKNLKFLLQKVLKQSDVGNLGRIVLPKKEAESHLPELESRDGISIAMEDIGTSRVWNMRYRFWPNNKSRMYLLENTGDFVRVNGLQEGDFIVIYSDTKCGKYMIRGVKVRQPGTKLEGKKPSRRNSRNLSFASNSSSLAPIKQAVR